MIPNRCPGRWAFGAWIALLVAPTAICAGDDYQIKIKAHPDLGKTAQVEQQETFHSQAKLVGIEVKKVLENNEEKKTTLYKYRETVLEKPDREKDAVRLRRRYEKAQVRVTTSFQGKVVQGGKTTALLLEGKTILIEKKNGRYRFSVEGGSELAGKDAEPLADEFQAPKGADLAAMLPEKQVRVNETHDIDPKVFLKGFAKDPGFKIDAAKAKGSWKLVKAYKKQGRQFGVMDLRVEVPLQELSSSPQAHPKAREKLVLRPGAKMIFHLVSDGCIDGSAATATTKVDMRIDGTALVPTADNPQFHLVLAFQTTTKVTIEESSPP